MCVCSLRCVHSCRCMSGRFTQVCAMHIHTGVCVHSHRCGGASRQVCVRTRVHVHVGVCARGCECVHPDRCVCSCKCVRTCSRRCVPYTSNPCTPAPGAEHAARWEEWRKAQPLPGIAQAYEGIQDTPHKLTGPLQDSMPSGTKQPRKGSHEFSFSREGLIQLET